MSRYSVRTALHERLVYALVACAALAAGPANAITVEFVTVGNPGNAVSIHGHGAVAYDYQIGKYEITAGQYTAFLNAVAADDIHNLYTAYMSDPSDSPGPVGNNVQRFGSPGNYTYTVEPEWADRPVNYVNGWDAARFANWLHNGQPTGTQGPGTTENGAYHDLGDPALFGRSAGALYFIPTTDEWYKAAFHSKGAGLVASYFDYPTRSNLTPGNDPTEVSTPGNNRNTAVDSQFAIGAHYYRSPVGEFELSESPYGTFDQDGNVSEWTEPSDGDGAAYVWGGAFTGRFGVGPQGSFDGQPEFVSLGSESRFRGFRLAAPVPEPGDYNGNGAVDAADYVVWRNTFGQAGAGLVADGNGDGGVDQLDYQLWRASFGQTAAPGAGATAALTSMSSAELPNSSADIAVPEPNTIILAALVLAHLAIRWRPRPANGCMKPPRW